MTTTRTAAAQCKYFVVRHVQSEMDNKAVLVSYLQNIIVAQRRPSLARSHTATELKRAAISALLGVRVHDFRYNNFLFRYVVGTIFRSLGARMLSLELLPLTSERMQVHIQAQRKYNDRSFLNCVLVCSL
jgi:hypothetical protein